MASSERDLIGRVAIVTGADSATGISFAVCERLGELAAAVALTATSDRVEVRARQLEEAGVSALGLIADLTQPAAPRALVREVIARWGRLDILVNNAGMISVSDDAALSGEVDGLAYDEWQHSLRPYLDLA
jgi:3-oxoacyl-[acyl-carrier protein] reductase